MNGKTTAFAAIALSLFVASTGSTVAFGQATPGNEVKLDMIVHDKSDKPVADLQPADIAVTDAGQPVTLTGLRLVSGKQEQEPKIIFLFNRPGVDSRQKASADTAQQTTKKLNEAAARLLKAFPESGFQYAVMDIWGRLQLQQVFTSDRKVVGEAIASAVQPGQIGVAVTLNAAEQGLDRVAQTGNDPSGATATPALIQQDQAFTAAIMQSITAVNEHHTSASLGSLLAIAQSEQDLSGRKALVYFTTTKGLMGDAGGTGGSDSKEAIQSIVNAANRAGLSIYIVLMEGDSADVGTTLNSFAALSTNSKNPAAPSSNAGKSGSSSSTTSNGYTQAAAAQFSTSSEFRYIASRQGDDPIPGTLDSLVRGTEGYAFSEKDNFSDPAKELISDLTNYYEASYIPATAAGDGGFHPVVVKPVRAGLRVRTRSGYVATSAKAN